MGSLEKLVSDMQTNGLPVDRAKAVPFHNPYSVPDDWDE
jgi:hypothetical protein